MRVEVSDGSDTSEVVVDVEVLADAPQPPTAVFDFETAFAEQTIQINPFL